MVFDRKKAIYSCPAIGVHLSLNVNKGIQYLNAALEKIIRKIWCKFRKAVLKLLISLRLPFSVKIKVCERPVVFHNIADSFITEKIALEGFEGYEYELSKFVQSYYFPIGTFIDAGANIGYYSVLSSLCFDKNVKILSVEPFPNNIEYMEKLKHKNGLTFDILPFALSEKTGEVKPFYVPTTHRSSKLSPAASLINSFKGSGGIYDNTEYQEIAVETITLNDLLDRNEGPYLIKLDIEGYELPVLKRLSDSLEKRNDIDFIVEIMINDADKVELFQFMKQAGYTGYLITNAGLIVEDRPLTLPYYNHREKTQRTCWKNHYFTKRDSEEIKALSLSTYGYFI